MNRCRILQDSRRQRPLRPDMVPRAVVLGCGAYLPARIVTNDELATRVDTSDEWIRQRTGITQRHIAADGELTSDLAFAAAVRALEHAGVGASDLDLIVLATSTPDETFPATAVKGPHLLGLARRAPVQGPGGRSGFIYSLAVPSN